MDTNLNQEKIIRQWRNLKLDRLCIAKLGGIDVGIDTYRNDWNFIPSLCNILDNKQTTSIIPLTIDEIEIPIHLYDNGLFGKTFDFELILMMKKNELLYCYSFVTKIKIIENQNSHVSKTSENTITISPLQVIIPSYTKLVFQEKT